VLGELGLESTFRSFEGLAGSSTGLETRRSLEGFSGAGASSGGVGELVGVTLRSVFVTFG